MPAFLNMFRTALLLAALTALFMGLGYLLGGTGGMLIALGLAATMNFIAYWNSDKMVLRLHRAREVDARSGGELYALIEALAHQADLPMPRVYLIDAHQPNAFATGRNPDNAAVAATTGLLSMLSREEIAAVMAHELAHIKNRDTLIMTITATIAGAVSMLANFAFFFGGQRDNQNPFGFVGIIVMAIVAPLAAMLVQLAISRTREYSADRLGAEICGRPEWLAAALVKIENAARHITNPTAEADPALAPLYIINPLSGARMDNLFSTHPSTENRVRALQALATSYPRQPSATGFSSKGPWQALSPHPGNDETNRGPWG